MLFHIKTPTGKHPWPQPTWPLGAIYQCKRKIYREICKRVSHNRSSTNDPPCSLNRDHGPMEF
jgi:hypothetical protein